MGGSEVLLYAYAAVCICMLIFNIIYDLVQKGRDRRLMKKVERCSQEIQEQLDHIRNGEELDEGYLPGLRRKLGKVNDLVAFDRAFGELLDGKDDPAVAEFQRLMQPVILDLTMDYQGRENIQAAYFAYFLSRHKLKLHLTMDAVQDIMVEYMRRDSLYCRVNALQALYEFGSPESVVQAVADQDRMGWFFHEKLLTDGLLSYTGDHKKLTELLWGRFDQFSNSVKLSILNYIRFRTGAYIDQMYAIMTDREQDKELRLAAIRYFGKYVYPPAKQDLLAFARDRDPLNWEYAAVSVSCLARYPEQDVVETLIASLHSSNWYVRYNASSSLEAQGLGFDELAGVVDSRDRYAREMIMYRLDVRRLEEEERSELSREEQGSDQEHQGSKEQALEEVSV